jgi:signal transduction histidine kinase
MFKTIRSKLFFTFGILGIVTSSVGITFVILFNNYASENKSLLHNSFPQVIRAGEFVAATNKLTNSGSLLISSSNKKELARSYNRINEDLSAFQTLTNNISKDPLFKNQIRFHQLAQKLGNTLDMSLQLRAQIFELDSKMDTFFHENNKHLKMLWDFSIQNNDTPIVSDIKVVQAMLLKLTAIQASRRRVLESANSTANNINSTPNFQEEIITASLAEKLKNVPEHTGKLNSIVSGYLKNYRDYLKSYEQFIKKYVFLKTSSIELKALESELGSLALNYQDVVLKHFQKNRDDLNKQVEQESIIILSIVVLSILFVALVIWQVSSRGIVSRLNYLVDAVLSDSKKMVNTKRSNDEIGKLSDAICNLLTGQRHLEFNNKIMEGIAKSKGIKGILKQIILFFESEVPGTFCSVLLLDEKGEHLINGVAPSLPSLYNSAMDGVTLGPNTGSCGTAAYKNELTIVEDISTNPLWENYAEIAGKAGLKACSSQPVLSPKGKVLGTFAVYYKTIRSPDEEELKLLKSLAYKAGFAIESKYQEKALREHTEKLKQSNQELENFAYIASHDLKEPLRKIIAFGDLLIERETNLSDRSKNYLGRMQKASLRMASFIEDLLEYSKVSINKDKTTSSDLAEVLAQVINDLESQIAITKAQVNISDLPIVNMNSHQAQRLFQNLLSNALKFHKKDTPPVINVTGLYKPDENLWEIRVEDNGIGFNEKHAHRIFTMFERLQGHSAYEGTGIGLAICEKIVKLHGGTITARSKVGEGATFIINLPEALSFSKE